MQLQFGKEKKTAKSSSLQLSAQSFELITCRWALLFAPSHFREDLFAAQKVFSFARSKLKEAGLENPLLRFRFLP